jgi:hypothetical protein
MSQHPLQSCAERNRRGRGGRERSGRPRATHRVTVRLGSVSGDRTCASSRLLHTTFPSAAPAAFPAPRTARCATARGQRRGPAASSSSSQHCEQRERRQQQRTAPWAPGASWRPGNWLSSRRCPPLSLAAALGGDEGSWQPGPRAAAQLGASATSFSSSSSQPPPPPLTFLILIRHGVVLFWSCAKCLLYISVYIIAEERESLCCDFSIL